MAKVRYSSLVSGIAGKLGDIVYYRSKSPFFGYIRQYVTPREGPNNITFAASTANISHMYTQLGNLFLIEFRKYVDLYRQMPINRDELRQNADNRPAVWAKAIWAFCNHHHESAGASTITLNDIMELYQIDNIADLVKEGYLPKVAGWRSMTTKFTSNVSG